QLLHCGLKYVVFHFMLNNNLSNCVYSRVMLWYQQPPGEKAVKLIGHVEYAQINYEESYKKHFNITGDMSVNTEKNGSLFIVDVKASEHSAVSAFNCTKTSFINCVSS
uniref:Immunoglobulin V-set domain-containing protein n=1 Tax=Stegastes partitus TaxID=144197 RepID=A0A3B4Z490_9TELE